MVGLICCKLQVRMRHLRRLSQLGQLSSASSGSIRCKNFQKVSDLDAITCVSRRDRLFGRRVAKLFSESMHFYCSKCRATRRARELVGVFTKTVRTPTPQALFGEQQEINIDVP